MTPAPEIPAYVETKAADWWKARTEDRRLPEHELPSDVEGEIWTQRIQEQWPS